jgi:hypothetical protein
VEAYISTGDRNYWGKVREVSQSIADRLRELDETRCSARKELDSLDAAIEELMVAEQ